MKLFEEQFTHDNRESILELNIPGLGKCGLSPPNLEYWMQLGAYLSIGSVFNLLAAVIVWFQVVKKRGSPSATITTFGFVVPFFLIVPIQLTLALEIKNTVLSFPILAMLPLNIFRCFEALYATSRKYVEADFVTFIMYYTFPVPFEFDRKTGRILSADKDQIWKKVAKILPGFVETSILLSFVLTNNYSPFPEKKIGTILDAFYWGNLLNTLALAYLLEIYLEFGTRNAAVTITLLSGLETIELNNHPLTMSTSVAEFWGVRWNKMVGENLRAGVFKPFIKVTNSKSFSVLATFLVSGLFHEFLIYGIATTSHMHGYKPEYFHQTIFFVWNGLVLITEEALSQNKLFRDVSTSIPRPIKTFVTVMTALPIAHFFLDQYISLGIFSDFAVAFPLIKRI